MGHAKSTSGRGSPWCTTVRRSMAMVVGLLLIALYVGVRYSSAQPIQVLLQGRFAADIDQTGFANLPVLFSWPASSIHASFVGDSVNATVSALPPTQTSNALVRFAFYVDQRQISVEATNSTSLDILWGTSGLGPGLHSLTITKLSEASYGLARLTDLTVGPGGRFVTPVLPQSFETGRRILVLGDSFTIGFANVGNYTTCKSTACNPISGGCMPDLETEDASVGWGPLTAGNFSADFQIIASSGAGLVTYSSALSGNSNIKAEEAQIVNPTDADLFSRQVTTDNDSTIVNYNYTNGVNGTGWVPQVVVIGGGGNDFHTPPPPIANWTSQVLDFIDTINEEYDTPEIILLMYPVDMFLQGILSRDQAMTYIQYMTHLNMSAQSEQMTNVHLLELSLTGIPLTGWCAAHLSAAADAAVATQLVSFINQTLPHWVNSTYPIIVDT